jgi:hypothetical protein
MAKSLRERIVELREVHNPSKHDSEEDNNPPESETRRNRVHAGRRRRRRGRGGWKRTLYFGAIWASTILILNLALVIWASPRQSPEGPSVLYAGDCGRTKTISSWVHVLINMLSTGMLGASHFAMVFMLLRVSDCDALVIVLIRFIAMSKCAGARGCRSCACSGEVA